jgi:steroid delta-isomerase-like uncharacterized protein
VPEDLKAISRRLLEEAFTQGRLEIVDEIVAAGYVAHDPASPEPVKGPDGLKAFITVYREAFPDLRATVEEQIAEGDKVLTRWSARGTHEGELLGIPPTGKQSTVTGMTLDRFEGGKIAESWDNWDTLGMLQQLGVVPEMAQT